MGTANKQSHTKNIIWGKMASPGQLCEVVAGLLGKSLPTVLAYDHQLAKAGLRTTGGRGRSAARMTATDAATLIIASIVSPTIKDTVEAFKSYSSLLPVFSSLHIKHNKEVVTKVPLGNAWDLRFMPVPRLKSLEDNHTFHNFLAAILEAVTTGEIKLAEHFSQETRIRFSPYPPSIIVPEVSITLTVPWVFARVVISTENFDEIKSYGASATASYVGQGATDMSADYKITDRTLFAVGKCLRDEPLGKIPSRKVRESMRAAISKAQER
jgi:hypothetical protein